VLQTLINIYYSSSRLPLSISAKPRNGSPIEEAANYIRALVARDYPAYVSHQHSLAITTRETRNCQVRLDRETYLDRIRALRRIGTRSSVRPSVRVSRHNALRRTLWAALRAAASASASSTHVHKTDPLQTQRYGYAAITAAARQQSPPSPPILPRRRS